MKSGGSISGYCKTWIDCRCIARINWQGTFIDRDEAPSDRADASKPLQTELPFLCLAGSRVSVFRACSPPLCGCVSLLRIQLPWKSGNLFLEPLSLAVFRVLVFPDEHKENWMCRLEIMEQQLPHPSKKQGLTGSLKGGFAAQPFKNHKSAMLLVWHPRVTGELHCNG